MTVDLILHSYEGSPYAEKIRLILGFKGLSYRSVSIPAALPRPLLMPLTGGHRRTPVLQVGADIYCDTRRITAYLEDVCPDPSLFPPGSQTLSDALAGWVEHRVFVTTGPARFQSPDDVVGTFGGAIDVETFANDRLPFMEGARDLAGFLSLVPAALDQVRAFLGFLDHSLANDRPYLTGENPSLADFASYPSVWRLRHPPAREELFARFPRVVAWADRVAAIGHGNPQALNGEDALAVAKSSEPATEEKNDPDDPAGRRPGDFVLVRPDDYGRAWPVRGRIVASSEQEIAVLHRDAYIGEVVVHFPRLGFEVLPITACAGTAPGDASSA